MASLIKKEACSLKEEITLMGNALDSLNIPKDVDYTKRISASVLAKKLLLAKSMLNKANETNKNMNNENEMFLYTQEKTKIILSKESVNEIIKSCEDAIEKLKSSLEARLDYIKNSNEARSLSSKKIELEAIPKKVLDRYKAIRLSVNATLNQIALLQKQNEKSNSNENVIYMIFGNNSSLQRNSNRDLTKSLL